MRICFLAAKIRLGESEAACKEKEDMLLQIKSGSSEASKQVSIISGDTCQLSSVVAPQPVRVTLQPPPPKLYEQGKQREALQQQIYSLKTELDTSRDKCEALERKHKGDLESLQKQMGISSQLYACIALSLCLDCVSVCYL